jgi:hypothetical protein
MHIPQASHFFAANRRARVISAAARGIAAGFDAFHAGVAELVDALDLGSSDESCGGSSPSARTKRFQRWHQGSLASLFPSIGFAERHRRKALLPNVGHIDHFRTARPDEAKED